MTTPKATLGDSTVAAYDCEDALPRLYEFIDNEISLDELQAMQAHLDGCDSCAYEHEVRTKLKSIIHEACFEPAPEELKRRVADNIARLREEFSSQ